jgi:hypothetical protein
MPQTYTELLSADTERKERALAYERALTTVAQLKKELPKAEQEVRRHKHTIKQFADMEDAAQALDDKAPGARGRIAKFAILDHLAAAQSWAQVALDRANAKLKTLQTQLPKAEATLATFTD